uniref:Uncharacterized protein n=1 Tax=Arundo donax TaxID=35708 RepID=A0A0A9GUC5_ARUDO
MQINHLTQQHCTSSYVTPCFSLYMLQLITSISWCGSIFHACVPNLYTY